MQRRLRKVRRRDSFLPNDNFDFTRARASLCFDPRLAAPQEDQQAPLSARTLHCDSQELLDQRGKDHLTRNRLRNFHYRLNIQLRGRLRNHSGGRSPFLSQARI
jgi:hypothetical protein